MYMARAQSEEWVSGRYLDMDLLGEVSLPATAVAHAA
jgi:hypothetical protein